MNGLTNGIQPGHPEPDYLLERTENGPADDLRQTPIRLNSQKEWNDANAPWRAGEFYHCLSPKAISEFESLAAPFCCEGTTALFTEEQEPSSVLFLLEGTVKLSINSGDGRRLILGIAGPGDILGLNASVLGIPYEMTAETQFPCMITSLQRQSFLDFLLRYPVAWQNVARQLSLENKKACERLRTLGLTLTAPARLARLLVEWCANGHQTERGIRIHCSLTHEEIGEYIGASRETVTRALIDFKSRELAEQRGSTLIVMNLLALRFYAARPH
jgi:CRP/FNR family transcriptional regulator, cyclic AMP receptor protein